LDEALKNFQLVTLSPDLKLQQQAYYNLGNVQYRTGELKFAPSSEGLDAMEDNWRQALQSYSPRGAIETRTMWTAAYNTAFVKRQIEFIAQLREAMRRARGIRHGEPRPWHLPSRAASLREVAQ